MYEIENLPVRPRYRGTESYTLAEKERLQLAPESYQKAFVPRAKLSLFKITKILAKIAWSLIDLVVDIWTLVDFAKERNFVKVSVTVYLIFIPMLIIGILEVRRRKIKNSNLATPWTLKWTLAMYIFTALLPLQYFYIVFYRKYRPYWDLEKSKTYITKYEFSKTMERFRSYALIDAVMDAGPQAIFQSYNLMTVPTPYKAGLIQTIFRICFVVAHNLKITFLLVTSFYKVASKITKSELSAIDYTRDYVFGETSAVSLNYIDMSINFSRDSISRCRGNGFVDFLGPSKLWRVSCCSEHSPRDSVRIFS